MIGYDLYNLGRDYSAPRDLGLQAMPVSSAALRSPSAASSLWGKAKNAIRKAPTSWGGGDPIAEGNATGSLASGVSALAGMFQSADEEKARQRGYAEDDMALANSLYEARRKRMQQSNALRSAAAV